MSLVGMFALEKDVATETTADIKGLEKGGEHGGVGLKRVTTSHNPTKIAATFPRLCCVRSGSLVRSLL